MEMNKALNHEQDYYVETRLGFRSKLVMSE